MCNSQKLIFDDDRLELRFMDEMFSIEKQLGEVIAVIGLQFQYEKEVMDEADIEYEHFPEPEVKEVKPKSDEDGEEEPVEQQQNEDEEEKKPKFKVEDYTWTVSDRRPKNLPQLFN